MKKLLLITGDLATGKSTFATILSRRYGTIVIYKDKIKEVLGDTIGFSDRKENLKLSKATMELMIHAFSEIAKLSPNVILEANFKADELLRLHKIAGEHDYDILTLSLEADINILYTRFVNRIENENRHPVHISGFDGFESFKGYIESSRKHTAIGNVIKISADDFSYQSDEFILSQIDKFIGVI